MTPIQQWQKVRSIGLPRYFDTGAIERGNPLPVGTYWVDVFEKDWELFDNWTRANSAIKAIKVLVQENIPASGGLIFNRSQARRWILFQVLVPNVAVWVGPGFPTIAETGVDSSDDTVSKPNVQDMGIFDMLGVTPGMQTSIKLGALYLGVAGVSYIGYRVAVKQGWL